MNYTLPRSRSHGVSWKKILLILGGVGVAACFFFALMVRSYLNAQAQTSYATCQRHLELISLSLDDYIKEHKEIPPTLEVGISGSLENVPKCTSPYDKTGNWVDTYSASYQVHQATADTPAGYSLYCGGENHKGLAPANYPAYRSGVGVLVAPGKIAAEAE